MKIYISPKESAKKESLLRILDKYGIIADFVEIPLEKTKEEPEEKFRLTNKYINSLIKLSK